jgi:hypothetical protein
MNEREIQIKTTKELIDMSFLTFRQYYRKMPKELKKQLGLKVRIKLLLRGMI